jgi:hypothetical protein
MQSRSFDDAAGDVRMHRKVWAPAAAVALAFAQTISGAARSDPESPGPLSERNLNAPAALAQCGDCHMVYPARMLPGRSWAAIVSKLNDHFGEDAAIPERDLAAIRDYLTANAADSPSASPKQRHFMSEIIPDSTPLRITATPWWGQMHADFHSDRWKHYNVTSPGNCLGCHK